MLKYKIVEQTARLGKYEGQQVQVAQQILTGQVTYRQLCERLSKDTTVGQADIRAVLYQLADVVAEYMELGMSVDCGELGRFRPTYGSRQVPVGEKFTHEDLRSPKITFVPRQKFKEFRYRAQFERISDKKDEEENASAGSTTEGESEPLGPNENHTGL